MNKSKIELIFKLPLLFSRFFQLFIGRVLGTILSIVLMPLLSTILLNSIIDIMPDFIMHNIDYTFTNIFVTVIQIYFLIGGFIAILPEYSYKRKLYYRD